MHLDNLLSEIQNGYIRAIPHPTEPYTLYNYTPKAQYEPHWTPETLACRGLILHNETREVIARPFDKFFNWGEGERGTNASMVSITEKIDGSLGILYRLADGGYSIATRGAFDSEQATWATNWLNENTRYMDSIPYEWTLLFEIVYPENRIVVDYGGTSGLCLLAIRNRTTGEYLPFYPDVYFAGRDRFFLVPQVHRFNSISDIISAKRALPATSEGWVVEFSDGQRFKFKGDRYVELHRIVTNASFGRVLEAMREGRYDEMIEGVPDEFLEQIKGWHAEISAKVSQVKERIAIAMGEAPIPETRKEFALWAKEYHPALLSYLFAALDARPLEPLIYKLAFRKHAQDKEPSNGA